MVTMVTTYSCQELRYAILVESVEGSAAFSDQYEFGIPKVEATCTCKCSKDGFTDGCQSDGQGFCDGYGTQDRYSNGYFSTL